MQLKSGPNFSCIYQLLAICAKTVREILLLPASDEMLNAHQFKLSSPVYFLSRFCVPQRDLVDAESATWLAPTETSKADVHGLS